MEVVLYGYVNPCGTNNGAIFYLGGDSNSTKPETWGGSSVGEGSLFLELDTGDFYYLKSQGSTQWVELIAEQTVEEFEPDEPLG